MSRSSGAVPANLTLQNQPLQLSQASEFCVAKSSALLDRWYFAYGLAVLAAVAATLLRILLLLLDVHAPFITYFPAIIFVALAAGQRPGILTTLLLAFGVDFRFFDAVHSLSAAHPGDALQLLLFSASGCAICLMAGALRNREQQLRNLFFCFPAPMAVFDASLICKRVNPAMARIHNRDLSEFTNQDVWSAIPEAAPALEPILKHVSSTGRALCGVEFSGELPVAPGEKSYLQACCFPLFFQGGRVRQIGAVVFDTSEIKRLKEALQRSEAQLRDLQKLTALGSWQWRFAGDLVTWSDEIFEIFGRDPAKHAVAYADTPKLFTPESWQRLRAAIDWTIQTGQPYAEELQLIRPDGTTRWTITRGQPEFDKRGSICGLYGTVQDITHLKRAETLSASLTEKETLLKEIHHRVKNNLQIVSSLLRMQARRVTQAPVRELFRESENRILSLSAIHETLYQASDFSQVNLTQYLRRVVEGVVASYNRPDTSCLFQDAQPVNIAMHLAAPCGLIVSELVSNAVKHAFGDSPGLITLSVRRNDSSVLLVVHDDGVGLSEPFETAGRHSMGLQLVQTLATVQLRGRINVSHDSGTTFQIDFEDAPLSTNREI